MRSKERGRGCGQGLSDGASDPAGGVSASSKIKRAGVFGGGLGGWLRPQHGKGLDFIPKPILLDKVLSLGLSPDPAILVRINTCISDLTQGLLQGAGAGQISWVPSHKTSLYTFWSGGH